MPFGITVAGDVFKRQLDQCFEKIDQLIVIVDDIMVVGKQHNHKDYGVALTNLLESTGNVTSGLTLTRCNTRILKLISLERHTLQMAASQLKARSLP